MRCRGISNQNSIDTYLLCAGPGIPNSNYSHVHSETLICTRHREKERKGERLHSRNKRIVRSAIRAGSMYRDGRTRDEPALFRIEFSSICLFFPFPGSVFHGQPESDRSGALRLNTNAATDWDRLTGFLRQSTREPKLSCYLPPPAPLKPHLAYTITRRGPRGNRPGKFLRSWEWICACGETWRLVGDARYTYTQGWVS